ncbi:MAG: TetR/AcrR family transcriptional regulator [Aquabacterium sp.]|uniref:TetR/AcrR family transcriptional regulator n=1 Tax=Aquabacterium sp. TaxID=1872578 RepID=UPI002722929C|nr:TetR/AcrR family transcriptional regulator [Aquabacterium sp.]MDO9002888.1 TetR/AcrR family transcriptional regulator [Aquabacterium sp.]
MTATRRPRVEKRKQATRLRLMEAAYALMAETGGPEVSIQEITTAADVGFGTFYTYFASKEAIYNALVEEVLEASGKVVDAATRHLIDPAERLSAGLQYTLLQARADPLWGKFLSSSLMRPASAANGLGKFFLRDVFDGLAQKRFKVDDVPMSVVAIVGTLHAMLRVERGELQMALGNLAQGHAADRAAAKDDMDLPRRTTALILRVLGISPEESVALVYKPLPPISGFARFFNGDSAASEEAPTSAPDSSESGG